MRRVTLGSPIFAGHYMIFFRILLGLVFQVLFWQDLATFANVLHAVFHNFCRRQLEVVDGSLFLSFDFLSAARSDLILPLDNFQSFAEVGVLH